VVDFVWVDGYFFTTDGEFLITTDINNPTSVNPLKYASSELDPDPVNALIKFKNEVYALNRHSIEVFNQHRWYWIPFPASRWGSNPTWKRWDVHLRVISRHNRFRRRRAKRTELCLSHCEW